MSLKRDHKAKNDYSFHRRVKKSAKQVSTSNLRAHLKQELLKNKE